VTQAGLALDQRHDPRKPIAHDGVAFPVTYSLASLHDGRSLGDAPPAKALTLPRCATAMAAATPLLAAAQRKR